MKKFLAMTLTIIMTCAALTACGDTAQPSEESKAETTTTTTTETTTETPAETEETTTTTTATENETTTTTEAAEETETAIITEETSDDTEGSVQTSKIDMNATMPVEAEESTDSNMMTVEDCIKKIVKDNIGEDVVSIELNEKETIFTITTNNGTSIGMMARYILDEYNSGELVDYNMFSYYRNDSGNDEITY